jgi:UDP:flavonoid glycosyltransferase YjiC (YdhE family)
MHIAMVSIGAYGHVLPTLPFVEELVKRGLRVTYFTTEDFRELVNPTGAKFIPVRSWMAVHAPQNENANAAGDNSVAASVPFLFLKEAGEYMESNDVFLLSSEDKAGFVRMLI